MYLLVRPKALKDKTYVDRSTPPRRFAIGKKSNTEGLVVFTSLNLMFTSHGSLLGFGAWTVLLCEVTSEATITPTKDLGTFISGGLRGGENYRTIAKSKSDAEFTKAVKAKVKKGAAKR